MLPFPNKYDPDNTNGNEFTEYTSSLLKESNG